MVNLRKYYYGMRGRWSLHFRVSERVSLWLANSFQLGRVHYRAADNSDGAIRYTGYRNKWRGQMNPLQTFALRFKI